MSFLRATAAGRCLLNVIRYVSVAYKICEKLEFHFLDLWRLPFVYL
jgi:hypothetical protein